MDNGFTCSSCLKGRKRNPLCLLQPQLQLVLHFLLFGAGGLVSAAHKPHTEALLFSQDRAYSKLTQQASGAQQNHAVDYSSCYLRAKSSKAWKGFSKQACVKAFGVTSGLAGQHPPPCCSIVAAWPQEGNGLCCLHPDTSKPVVTATV